MKILRILCFSATLLLLGCGSRGKNVTYKIEEGDIRLTINRDYIIIDTCSFINGFGQTIWEFGGSINKSDSTAVYKLLEKLKITRSYEKATQKE